jgi:dTDP-4-amino-4,6-dideoxygalactose transaminase
VTVFETERIRLSKSVVGPEEAEAVTRVICEDGYLGMGQEVRLFEEELRRFLGGDVEIITVSTGTAALHLATMAVLSPGDEVLVQSLTFLSSFQAIGAANAIPVPCEVISETITIDLEDAEKKLTSRTRAIMPVHYASNPADRIRVYQFARTHHLRVIEDAAHAFGCVENGRVIGSDGDVVCFSFDGIKNITSGEGGAVVTKDPRVAEVVRDARLLSVRKDTEKRFEGQRSWEFDVTRQGYRFHMSNIFAAIGRVQLRRFEREFRERRVTLARNYRSALREITGLVLLAGEPGDIVPHIFPIRVLDGKRDGLRRCLESQNIESGIHYQPNHLLSLYGARSGQLPRTEALYRELLTLPLHPDLSDSDQERVISTVRDFFESNSG